MTLNESYRYCRKLAKRTGKNFYYSFLTLPQEKHLAMCAVYAWMRLLDDCVDDASGPEKARAELDRWEKKTREVLAGSQESCDPDSLWPAFRDTVGRFNIPDDYFFEIIRGVEMDLTVHSYETFDDLYKYCYRVASVVGLACLHVMGFTHPQAKKHGEWLGIAFQLTNILRDVKEDAQRGRIYLPADALKAFGINPQEILELQWSEELHDLIESYSQRAEMYYLKAQPLFGMVLPDARPTLEIMAEIYGGILRRLQEIDYQVFSHRARLSLGEKLMAVARRRFRKVPAGREETPPPDLTPKKLAIIGGGAAGLAVATALTEFGFEISIFEKKLKLGGKAAWFTDPRHQEDLENPLQLWLSAHVNTGKFFRMIGARRFFERRSAWTVLVKDRLKTFKPSGRLPFPLHWVRALRKLQLGWGETRRVLSALLRLSRYDGEEEARLDRVTFLDWLRAHDQGDRAIERFWKPFLGIAIPDRINRLSTRQVASFIRCTASSGPLGWYFPTGLGTDIYNEVCRTFLKSRHVKVRTHENISGVYRTDNQWNVVTGDGATHLFDDVVVTLPHHLLRHILNPKDFAVLSARTQFEKLGFTPALLARLEFRQPLFEERFTVLNETPFSWGIAAQVPRISSVKRAPFMVTFAGHDSRPYVFTQNYELLSSRVRDIWENVLGEGSMPAESEFLCDVDRDFASEPGSFGHRPSQETSLPGFWLAADWTQTRWPAGLEGSLDAGFRCAEKILEKRGWKIRLGSGPA